MLRKDLVLNQKIVHKQSGICSWTTNCRDMEKENIDGGYDKKEEIEKFVLVSFPGFANCVSVHLNDLMTVDELADQEFDDPDTVNEQLIINRPDILVVTRNIETDEYTITIKDATMVSVQHRR